MRRRIYMLPALVPIIAGFPLMSPAAPDFSGSTVTVSSESPLEADPVRFSIHLKNTGDTPAGFARLDIEWPLMGYLIECIGLEDATVDQETRKISASLDLAPGGEKTVHLDVLAPRDSGGDALSVSVHLAHYASGAEWWDHKTITIETRIEKTGIPVGGYRVTTAGLGVLIWLVLFVLLWIVIRLRFSSGAGAGPSAGWRSLIGPRVAAAALMIPIGFWLIFAAMVWRDYRILNTWPETTATVIGRRTVAETVTSSKLRGSGSGTSTSSEVYSPELALRYQVDGKEIFSTGYDSGSSLRFGGRPRREKEIRAWTAGTRIPCWYDPDNPRDVVVQRGFGGAYLFALLPLPVFWLGLSRLSQSG